MIGVLWAATAAATPFTGDLCVDVNVDFDDLAGDRWIDNDVDRAARGVEVELRPQGGTWSAYRLDEDGCLRDVTVTSGNLDVRITSNAIVSGVVLESWSGPSDDGRPQHQMTQNDVLDVQAPFSITVPFTPTGDDPPSVWRNLLVATMVFQDTDWNIGIAPSRDCCIPGVPGLGADGTCGNSLYEYPPLTGPLQLQAHQDLGNQNSPQSRLVDGNGDDDGAGVYSHRTREKRSIAHEVGHVILYHRAGGQEAVEDEAPMDDCNGTRDENGDLQSVSGYGLLTKEFLSVGLKEGWADFVAARTWNDPSTAGCDLQKLGRDHDLNLNGTLSLSELGPSYRSAHPAYPDGYRTTQGVHVSSVDLGGTLDCDGDPYVEGMDPAYTWSPGFTIDGKNWLSDLIDANDAAGCEAAADPDDEHNRTTRYDVVRMFWAMHTDQGLSANQLSNLMTETCFRTWDPDDASSPTSATLPFRRLQAAADFLPQAVEDALDAEDDHVFH